jgi:C4-type Zn-finger protein
MKNNVSARIMESMLKESQFKSNKQGECPVCGKQDLDYGAAEFEGDMMYFPWTCNQCKAQGEEWYSMEFTGHNVNTEEGNIEVDL